MVSARARAWLARGRARPRARQVERRLGTDTDGSGDGGTEAGRGCYWRTARAVVALLTVMEAWGGVEWNEDEWSPHFFFL